MNAKDVMTTKVVAVDPDMPVHDIAALLLAHHISAVPVIDEDRRVLGIVSEGDLLPRAETERRQSWWLAVFGNTEDMAREFVRVHGQRAREIMTPEPVIVTEETPLAEIARLLEERRIKRVPVTRDGRLVGIVSRADVLRGLAARGLKPLSPEPQDDRAIRHQFLEMLKKEPWTDTHLLSVVVDDGVIHLWGLVHSNEERRALRVAAETIPGARGVEDHLCLFRRVGL